MTHTSNNMKEHPEHVLLESTIKNLLCVYDKILYKDNDTMKVFIIKCINCNKIVRCEMGN